MKRFVPAVIVPALAAAAFAQPCQPHWEAWGGGLNSGGFADWLEPASSASGPVLYASGYFTSVGGVAANSIAVWNGSTWSALGGGMTGSPIVSQFNPTVTSLAVYTDGSGTQLYAGGWYRNADGQLAGGIARWNGTAWSTFAPGLVYQGLPQINAMVVFDDGSGVALYVGGSFTTIANVPARGIARWNGTAWQPVGAVVTAQASPWVTALTVFDDGNGAALYAGGSFTTIGGVTATSMARWNGTTWVPIGDGFNNFVNSLAVYDDGHGAALYAAGNFTASGAAPINRVAKWTGSQWVALGTGIEGTGSYVECQSVFDDGSGSSLYVGGLFTTAGGQPASNIARWNGTSWSTLAGGVNGTGVLSLAPFNDGSGTDLYVGGLFTAADGIPTTGLARWTHCPACYANCDHSSIPPVLNVNDFQCFLNTFAVQDPAANCDGSTTPPILNVNDFQCFLNAFAVGCP